MSSGNISVPQRRDLFLWSGALRSADYVVARYWVGSLISPEDTAINMAMEQSAATLRIDGYFEPDSLTSWTIRVLGARASSRPVTPTAVPPYNLPTEVYGGMQAKGGKAIHSLEIELAIPRCLLAGKPAQLMNVVVGELPRLGFLLAFCLLEAPLPGEFGPGPAFGADGIRSRLGVAGPVLCRSMRPGVGLDRATQARLNRDVLEGGFHAVKDDELAVFAGLQDFRTHLQAMVAARDAASQVSGERKAYIANLICEPAELAERFEVAVELGVDGVLVAPFIQGLGVLPYLARQGKLPILAHNTGADLLVRHPEWGLSDGAVCSWLRRLGADWVVSPGGFAASREVLPQEAEFVAASQVPLEGVRRVMPILQGGKEPDGLPGYLKAVGNRDFMLIVASWVDRHPDGLKAGARAFRRAVDGFGF
jgi:2,3-diketo-5-methylthiopentyl-1-phosphate enolase